MDSKNAQSIVSIMNYPKRETGISFDPNDDMTDQSYKNSCDINSIMKQYEKTGLLPQQTSIPAKYGDFSETPDLIQAFNIASRAVEAFDSLPPDIRKAMDNNPENLEIFIQDPANYELLKTHGVLIERKPADATNQDIINALKENNKPKET